MWKLQNTAVINDNKLNITFLSWFYCISTLTVPAILSVNTLRSNQYLFQYNNYSNNSIAYKKLLYITRKIP